MRALLDLLFPQRCAGCGGRPAPGLFCDACDFLVEPLPSWRCASCAGNLPPPLDPGARPGPCARCVGAPPPFAGVFAPFVYGGPVATAIHRLKYRGEREVASKLGPLLVEAGAEPLARADSIVPIPLHPKRRRERGFDQALLLARAVSRRSGLPLEAGLLRRRKEGLHQVGTGREGRDRNVSGAFSALPLGGRSVVVVDDVVTTGATSLAAAAALSSSGAGAIWILAAARAL